MSHYKNSTKYTYIENKFVVSFKTRPENGYTDNFQISWRMIWQLIKAKFKKSTMFIWARPGLDNCVYIEFREIYKKFNIPKDGNV